MFISSEGNVLCHVLVIVILPADVSFCFGSQFHSLFHIFHRAVFVTFQQFDATSFVIGLCKLGLISMASSYTPMALSKSFFVRKSSPNSRYAFSLKGLSDNT